MAGQNDPEDWSTSPEAYFLTSEERAEWKALDSGRERDRFKERYWLKRDPTAGTEKNEFRDTVLARIQTADKRFPLGKIAGARTNRGKVFVVFGTPARVNDTKANPLERPRPGPPETPRRSEASSKATRPRPSGSTIASGPRSFSSSSATARRSK